MHSGPPYLFYSDLPLEVRSIAQLISSLVLMPPPKTPHQAFVQNREGLVQYIMTVIHTTSTRDKCRGWRPGREESHLPTCMWEAVETEWQSERNGLGPEQKNRMTVGHTLTHTHRTYA